MTEEEGGAPVLFGREVTPAGMSKDKLFPARVGVGQSMGASPSISGREHKQGPRGGVLLFGRGKVLSCRNRWERRVTLGKSEIYTKCSAHGINNDHL